MKLMNSYFGLFKVLIKQRIDKRYFNVCKQIKNNQSYVFKNGKIPLSNVLIGELLDKAADAYGDHTALISDHQGISKSYLDLRNEVEKLASGFIACGFRKGDRVAVYSPTCYEWPLSQLAAAKAGLVLVAINYTCTAQEVEHCLKKVRCKALISYEKLRNQNFYEVLNKIIPDLDTSDPWKLQSDRLPDLEKIIMISDKNYQGTLNFKDVLEAGNKNGNAILSDIGKSLQFDDVTNILFTSGTTGAPKAAAITNHSLVNNAIHICSRLEYDKMAPVICCPVPFFHIFGSNLGTLGMVLSKSTTILPSAAYDSVQVLRCIEQYKCNATYGTPTMLIDLLRKCKELQMNLSFIKTIVVGASSVSVGLLNDLYSSLKEPNIHVAYGLTESCGAMTLGKSRTDFETLMSGYIEPMDEIEIKIINGNGDVIPKNNEGEICSRGYSTFNGYWNDKEKTYEVIDKDKWLHSGDIGVMNENGSLKIVGRIKDIIIRGGENIFLPEIENFLSKHPAILEVYVCGVPDERLGEELCCWINVKPNMSVTEDEVRQFCKEKMSYFKIPRYIMFVEDFPRLTSGKIKKYEMTEISKKKLNL